MWWHLSGPFHAKTRSRVHDSQWRCQAMTQPGISDYSEVTKNLLNCQIDSLANSLKLRSVNLDTIRLLMKPWHVFHQSLIHLNDHSLCNGAGIHSNGYHIIRLYQPRSLDRILTLHNAAALKQDSEPCCTHVHPMHHLIPSASRRWNGTSTRQLPGNARWVGCEERTGLSSLRGSATQNLLISQLCFTVLKMKLYVCRNLCENFRQIGQKIKKL